MLLKQLLPLLALSAPIVSALVVPPRAVANPPSLDLLSNAAASALNSPSSESSHSTSVDDLRGKHAIYENRVLLIRHGEKRRHGKEGLSKAGRKRAQCLRRVLGRRSRHSVGLIIAQAYNPVSGTRARPYFTVLPLARDLGLEVRTDCERDDGPCVRRLVEEFAKKSDKDVLICWKHSFLHNIAKELGSNARLSYPDDRFDIMWVLHHRKIISKESEKCRGIDDGRSSTRWDPDLEVEPENFEDDEEEDSVDKDELMELLGGPEKGLEQQSGWEGGQVPFGLD